MRSINNVTTILQIFLLGCCLRSHAQTVPANVKTTVFKFASVEQGKKLLTQRDAFVQRMSPYDRAARMKTDRGTSEEDYLRFVSENVLAWDEQEQEKLSGILEEIQSSLQSVVVPFPPVVWVVKTTGKEEGNAPYTRGITIVLPASIFEKPVEHLEHTLYHELFHIVSRANPDLREKLYNAIGFEKIEELEFPKELASRKITNPDAPKNDHCIRIRAGGESRWAVPILFSSTEKPDLDPQSVFFDSLQFTFLIVERTPSFEKVTPVYNDGSLFLVNPGQLTGLFEQIGRNTNYNIHPEEVLADNFALCMTGQTEVPSPDILEKIKSILDPKEK